MTFADTDDTHEDEEEMDPSDQPVAKKMRSGSGSDSGTKAKRKGRVLIEVTWNSYHLTYICTI